MGVATFRRLHERQRAMVAATLATDIAATATALVEPALSDAELEQATAPAKPVATQAQAKPKAAPPAKQ